MTATAEVQLPEIQITMIPPEGVGHLWPEVSPHFEKAIEMSHGRWKMHHLLDAILGGKQQLWIIYRPASDNEIIGAITTQAVGYPCFNMLTVQFLGGTDFDEWMEPMDETLVRFAKDMGCEGVEGGGRFGFLPWLKKAGYDKPYAFYEKRI